MPLNREISFLLLLVFGFAAGVIVSGCVFAIFTAVGLVPRFADRFHLAEYILHFEDMIILGVMTGTVLSLFYSFFRWIPDLFESKISQGLLLGMYGCFSGIYVGCLSLSVADILDALPIMGMRLNIKKGIGILILFFALGKLLGAFCFFAGRL